MRQQLQEFDKYIENMGKSKNTRLSYDRDLRQLIDYLEGRGLTGFGPVTATELSDYLAELKAAGKSSSTISRAVASIKQFYAFLMQKGYVFQDVSMELQAPKVIKKAPKVAGGVDMEKLLQAPDVKTEKGLRDKAMLELLACTGLRVSELLDIRRKDLDMRQRQLKVTGGKARTIPVSKTAARAVQKYLDRSRQKLVGDKEDEGYLFVSCQGDHMTRQGFWKLLKGYGREAGIKTDLTPHTLRHSFAVAALQRGENIRTVQTLLGHSDISSTNEYADYLTHENPAGYLL